jgi:hypothetical protein
VYDHDLQEVEELGWEEFIARQWDSIFVGYRTWSGMRTTARRWSDLIEDHRRPGPWPGGRRCRGRRLRDGHCGR